MWKNVTTMVDNPSSSNTNNQTNALKRDYSNYYYANPFLTEMKNWPRRQKQHTITLKKSWKLRTEMAISSPFLH